MVGDICVVGEPITDGEIEIGYGTYEEFRKKELITEAISDIINWAKTQPKVFSIIASTEKENIASYTILLKIILLKQENKRLYVIGHVEYNSMYFFRHNIS